MKIPCTKTSFLGAFSLIELLVGLIIISLALAAFAPMMSKRAKNQKAAMASKMTDRCASISPDCLLCYISPRRCITCRNDCTQNQRLNYSNCQCVNL